MIGPPRKALPDLAVIGATALLPMLLGTRIVRTVGAASAICGVYLLPASSLSLLLPSVVPPPPLLLVPAILFELAIWLEPSHLAAALDVLPGQGHLRHRPVPTIWQPTAARSAFAGAVFGFVLALVEPPFRVFLGDDPALWFGWTRWLAAIATTVVCAGLATLLTVRGRAA